MTKRYVVTGEVTISVRIVVDAESEKEARAMADEAPMQELCYHCSIGDPNAWSTSGELDGTPKIETVTVERKRKAAR